MTDVREEIIMSVELAIQRELAYRRKVAMLPSISDSKFCTDLRPMEVQSSCPIPGPSPSPRSNSGSSGLSGIEWQALTAGLGFMPAPHQNYFKVQSSSACPSPSYTSSSSCSSPSLLGIKRQAPRNSLEILASRPNKLKNRMDNFFCKVCQVPCSSQFCYMQHLKGKKHKINIGELEIVEKDKKQCEVGDNKKCELGDRRIWCGLCMIWCMNEDNFKEHLNGKKHKDVIARHYMLKNWQRESSKRMGV